MGLGIVYATEVYSCTKIYDIAIQNRSDIGNPAATEDFIVGFNEK